VNYFRNLDVTTEARRGPARRHALRAF